MKMIYMECTLQIMSEKQINEVVNQKHLGKELNKDIRYILITE